MAEESDVRLPDYYGVFTPLDPDCHARSSITCRFTSISENPGRRFRGTLAVHAMPRWVRQQDQHGCLKFEALNQRVLIGDVVPDASMVRMTIGIHGSE
jgi:hypothetical protein